MLWTRVATVAMLAVLLGVSALGGTLGVEFDTTDPLVMFLDSQATIGFAFRPTTDLTIDGLGYWGPDSFGTAVRLYDVSGRVLAAALVLNRDPEIGPEELNYHMAPITPLLLTAGNTYYVAGYADGGDAVVIDDEDPATHPFIEYLGAVSQVGHGLPRTRMYTLHSAYTRFGLVNFRIAGQTAGEVGIPGGGSIPGPGPISGPGQIPGEVGAPGAAVPEPGTFVLWLSGMLLLLLGRSAIRRRASAAAFLSE